MNRGLMLVSFSIIVLLSLNLISAGWFSEKWEKITGFAISEDTNPNPVNECKNSCNLNGECIPVGYRTQTTYCDSKFNISELKADNSACFYDYECESNICSSAECASAGLIKRFFSWASGDSNGRTTKPILNQTQTIQSDFDGDGCVGFQDFLMFSQSYGKEKGLFSSISHSSNAYDKKLDLNNNDKIDFPDFLIFSQEYNKGCSTNQPTPDLSTISNIQTAQKSTINCNELISEEQKNECWIIKASTERRDSFCENIIDSENSQNQENLKSVCIQKSDYPKYLDITPRIYLSGVKDFVIYEDTIYMEGGNGRIVFNMKGEEIKDPLLGEVLSIKNQNKNCLMNNCEGQYINFEFGVKGYTYGPEGLFVQLVESKRVTEKKLRLPPQIKGILQIFIYEDKLNVLASGVDYSKSSLRPTIGELEIEQLEYGD